MGRPLKAPTVPDYRPAPLHRPGVPGRVPVNDPASHPFRKRFPKPAWRPAKVPGRWRFPGRALGPFGAALGAADLIERFFPDDKGAPVGLPRAAGFVRTHGPFSWASYNRTNNLDNPPLRWAAETWPGPIDQQAVSFIYSISASRWQFGIWWHYQLGTGPVWRAANYERWERPKSETSTWTMDRNMWPGEAPHGMFPAPNPYGVPYSGYPETYPYPAELPGQFPETMPYRDLPHIPPNPFDDRGYYPPGVLRPSKPVPLSPSIIPPPRGMKVEQTFSVNPRAATQANPRLRRREDNRRKKDRKGGSTIVGTAWRLIGAATEAGDVVEVAFDSLPDAIRKKYRGATLFEKGKAVARHWEDVDLNQFFLKLIENQLEDAIYGLWGRFGSKASAKLGEITGKPYGIETGEGQRGYFRRGAETQYDYDRYQRFNDERISAGRKPVSFKHWKFKYDEKAGERHPFSLPVDEFSKRAQKAMTEGGFGEDRLGDYFGR